MNDDELEALAQASEGTFQRRKRTVNDFRYDEQQEKYWDVTTGNLLGAKSVDGAIHIDDWPTRVDGRTKKKDAEPKPYSPASAINSIDTGLTVEGSTWWPGKPQFIENTVISERGAMRVKGAICYNAYLPPERKRPPAGVDAQVWIDHVKRLYPEPAEHEHFFNFCAHMVQFPDEKVNHGIVLAGAQGIGKDTAMVPVREGVGQWNAAEVGPDAVTSQYNGYLKSVLLVINEVRPHDEDYKAANFYNLLKPLLAAPPEMLPMTLKYANTIYVRNLCHVILTTNDPLTLFIPPEDRRLFVMTSALGESPFSTKYFNDIYEFFDNGGIAATVEWLLKRDIFEFYSKRSPAMTPGKQAIIDSGNQTRRTVIDDLFEFYIERICNGKRPEIVFHADLIQAVRMLDMFDDEQKVIGLLNAKNFHFKMADQGYDMLRCPDFHAWINGKYRTRMAFISKGMPQSERVGRTYEALKLRPLAMN